MLGSLFGGGAPAFIPMTFDHLTEALAIIEETDEDDAEEAAESLMARGTEGMYVLRNRGRVVGITGSTPVEDSEDAVWLSWTYLTHSLHGQGHGRMMVEELLKILNLHGIRKMFIATSNYREDGKDIYAGAHRFYESLGAVEEMRLERYHSPTEAKIIYGLVNPGVQGALPSDPSSSKGIRFTGINPAPESEAGFGLDWSEENAGIHGLNDALSRARSHNARLVVAALPADLSDICAPELQQSGFIQHGTLTDYYAHGMNQNWWALS